jgi:Ser/Thr protein kinase RdoA (MazF antagonist)
MSVRAGQPHFVTAGWVCATLVTVDLAERLLGALPVGEAEELAGGHQSRVFRVIGRDGVPAAVKVLDASMVARVELDARLDVTAALADRDSRVCRPLLLGAERVTELIDADGRACYVVCFEFAGGREPDPAVATDVERLGMALAQLHATMRLLPPAPLPLVAALQTRAADASPPTEAHQILHGDYNTTNLRLKDGVVRVFDFDDCGYGPPAFDVANALYMQFFDACLQRFGWQSRPGRSGVSSQECLSELLMRLRVHLRVKALGAWLDDLDNAPIGIRTASPAWHATLRSFLADYGRMTN